MRKVLVTGGGGHLGSHLLTALNKEYEAHAIVRTIPDKPVEKVNYHLVDLSKPWSAGQLPPQIDAIVHLAQARNYRDFPKNAPEIFRVNVESTAMLLDYAVRAGSKHFFLASTGGLYKPNEAVLQEDSPILPQDGPLSYYLRSKWCGEILAVPYRSSMYVNILRPFFIYGPGQTPDKMIARIISRVQAREPISIIGKGGTKLNPVYVQDVVDLVIALLQKKESKTINVAGPQVVSIRDIAEKCGKALGVSVLIEEEAGRPSSFISNYGLMEDMLSRRLRSFDEGLRAWLK